MAQAAPKPSTPPAKAATAPAPSAQPITPKAYISNPFGLINPSLRAIGLNLGAAIGAIVLSAIAILLIVATGVGGIVAGVLSQNSSAVIVAVLLTAALVAAATIILGPLTTIIFLESAKGNKLKLGEAFRRCWSYCLRVFGAAVLTALAVLGGLILLIIPGIIFGLWFSLSAFVIIDQNVGVIEGMKRSKALVQGRLIDMLGLYGLPNILNFVPFIAGLAQLALGTVTLASPAVRYLQLKELKAKPPTAKPPIHWGNYAVIVLVLIGFVAAGYQSATYNPQPQPSDYYQVPADY